MGKEQQVCCVALFRLSLKCSLYTNLLIYSRGCVQVCILPGTVCTPVHKHYHTCSSVLRTENVARGETESFQHVGGAKVYMMY